MRQVHTHFLVFRDHAKELGNAVPTKPLLFMKPPSSFVVSGQPIEIPPGCTEIHHELELGVLIGSRARKVTEAAAMAHVGGYVLAVLAHGLWNGSTVFGLGSFVAVYLVLMVPALIGMFALAFWARRAEQRMLGAALGDAAQRGGREGETGSIAFLITWTLVLLVYWGLGMPLGIPMDVPYEYVPPAAPVG